MDEPYYDQSYDLAIEEPYFDQSYDMGMAEPDIMIAPPP